MKVLALVAAPLDLFEAVKSLLSALIPLFRLMLVALFLCFSGETTLSRFYTLLLATFRWRRVADISLVGIGLC